MKNVALSATAEARLHTGAIPAVIPALLEMEAARSGAPVTVVFARHFKHAEAWLSSIRFFHDHLRREGEVELMLLPEPPDLAEDDGPDASDDPRGGENELDRIATLTRLAEIKASPPRDRRLLLITSPRAFFAPTPRLTDLTRTELRLRAGERVEFSTLRERLGSDLGYDHEAVCEYPGQFAIRGGIVDIYPVNLDAPLRLDFFGDDLETIRTFDPTTQRTLEDRPEVLITARNLRRGEANERTILEYFGEATCWVFVEPDVLADSFPEVFTYPERYATAQPTFHDLVTQRAQRGDCFVGLAELEEVHALFPANTTVTPVPVESLEPYRHRPLEVAVGLERVEAEREARRQFLQTLLTWQSQGDDVRVVTTAAGEEERLRELIAEDEALRPLAPSYLRGHLPRGFRLALTDEGSRDHWRVPSEAAHVVFVTDNEILGRFRNRPSGLRKRRLPTRTRIDQLLDFSELADGDYLVHLSHGICIFRGVTRMEMRGKTDEVISLEFDEGLTLHLPLTEAHLLSRYVGLSKVQPKLGRLGTNSWEKTRKAAEKATLDFAAQMLALQAEREKGGGHPFPQDTHWQQEFEGAFPFQETPDQHRAIVETKADMEKPRPMDRLICGDVGFGKTEVAIRAAFKAVMDNHQVAILVPTTILAQQHFNTFRERMAGFPVTVEMVSRFRGAAQQKEILSQVAQGRVDILIGTHRLLSKDVTFKNLGLLVIDEEHRFGVRHKERLKEFRANVDVLTMSATPIPRTLYMALMGARDLSVIETPPQDRLPIRTIVRSYDDQIVEKAIRYELERGGQVFYLHNRVQTIDQTASRIQEMVPDARVALSHGQMDEEELEEIMTRFVAGDHDILVCTTIIENGLDIPNCNTIIIEGADRFGLSQLYQLRGRVGRFKRQAYAYLLLRRHARFLDLARERLSALRQHTQLGAGFKIAMRDLELRGAGNLLGPQQSGHIAGVGFELYCQLLRQSIARLKGEEASLRIHATVTLDFVSVGQGELTREGPRDPGFHLLRNEELDRGRLDEVLEAFLPTSYIQETRLRIDLYRRLSLAESVEQVKALAEEMRDRFGALPEPVEHLVSLSRIRALAEDAGLSAVSTDGNRLKLLRATNQRDDYVKHGGQFPRLESPDARRRLAEIESFLRRYRDEAKKPDKSGKGGVESAPPEKRHVARRS